MFNDGRITDFDKQLGGFAGKRVLELGPLESGDTCMMTQRGATVTAIEANLRAWMRCLVVKDSLNLAGDKVTAHRSDRPAADRPIQDREPTAGLSAPD